jgi:hypothetical protein
MKNLFRNSNHTVWILTAALGAATATGFGIWYFLLNKSEANSTDSPSTSHRYLDHRNPKAKKHKTDVAELKDIIHGHA